MTFPWVVETMRLRLVNLPGDSWQLIDVTGRATVACDAAIA